MEFKGVTLWDLCVWEEPEGRAAACLPNGTVQVMGSTPPSLESPGTILASSLLPFLVPAQ